MKQVAEKMFPQTLEAIYWAMKKYPDEKKYRMELRPMHGVGTKVIIYERAPVVAEEPVQPVTQKRKGKKNGK
jgi:hypothetical protein